MSDHDSDHQQRSGPQTPQANGSAVSHEQRQRKSSHSLGKSALQHHSSSVEDFVTQDVNDALREAREIATKGRARENPRERLRSDTTTVKVTKCGTKNDQMRVVVARSKVVSNSDVEDGEEFEGWRSALVGGGSYSDSEFPLTGTMPFQHKRSLPAGQIAQPHLVTALSEGELTAAVAANGDAMASPTLPQRRHTNVRYRRRNRDAMWRKMEPRESESNAVAGLGSSTSLTYPLLFESGDGAEADDEMGEDLAKLEVDVQEEECTTDEGTHLVIKTWEARWTVQNFELLPEWLQDNEFLMTGHRPPLPSFAECFKSILSLHTETGNIWTHLLGCLAFFVLACYFLFRTDHPHFQLQEKFVFSFFFIGAIVCLGLSFVFHTVCCHSSGIQRAFSKLDYMGISLLIVGSFIPWIYYGFYCRREPKISYITMVSVLGAGAIVVSLWDKFGEKNFRPLRAIIFAGMGLSGVVPTVHFILTDGVHRAVEENSFYWLLIMAVLYLFGTLLYATRTPERFFPGYCDIWFHSHQLFHLCVVCAAFTHYYGVSEMAMKKLAGASCDLGGEFSADQRHDEL